MGLTNVGMCIDKNFSLQLYGSFQTQEVGFLYADVVRCQQNILNQLFPGQNKKCKSQQEIDKVVDLANVLMVFLQQRFDENNFEVPIQDQIDTRRISIMSDTTLQMAFQVQQNTVYAQDNWLSNGLQQDSYVFNEVSIFSQYSKRIKNSTTDPYLRLQFIQDESKQTINRQAYTLFDAFTYTGGLMSIIYAFAQFLTRGIQKQLYYQSLIKRLYLQPNIENLQASDKHELVQEQKIMPQKMQQKNNETQKINNLET
ncbi:UNKNOWN [Stylonychia lemnae]|uniref:Uncharacterized protein n=1 Tax=Stylonychia lemnae TaxID=5949 RepID=A0A078AB49_STYLE|nr:UNKNOWN [Stylonychia lemnae]|eukprot:CDW78832.1 UNKNOWN [Stylonychia lemnae]